MTILKSSARAVSEMTVLFMNFGATTRFRVGADPRRPASLDPPHSRGKYAPVLVYPTPPDAA
jgi:hypothetical protein